MFNTIETPSSDQTPAFEVTSAAEETPVSEVTPAAEESQAADQSSVLENSTLPENEQTSTGEQKSSDEQTSPSEPQSPVIHTLRASSLYKTFGKKKVVQGIDFEMKTGEVLGLLGPNGSGKTTTFYMIVGFYKPTQGEVFLDGERMTDLAMYRRAQKGISYLPQEPSVFKKMTVEDNIWSILETRTDLTAKQKKDALEQLIEEFAITKIRRQKAYTLSGGERRRTEIARSLAIQPKFLMLDEPFAGIDPIAVADIKNLIKLLVKRGIGILITDHNVRDTLEITDRAIIINNGQIITQGSKEDILKSEQARTIYLGTDFEM
ncbi:MAG: LPS export ABC transporter ATP-binding protein [Treponema sp.]|nr:LPS export ABC transporter ATP-binding protein [Candidatus Treponema scatequi]